MLKKSLYTFSVEIIFDFVLFKIAFKNLFFQGAGGVFDACFGDKKN